MSSEKNQEQVRVQIEGIVREAITKFGAVVGDNPGSLIKGWSIKKRLNIFQ